MARLILKLSNGQTRDFNLTHEIARVGRNPAGDLVLTSRQVSFNHAKIVRLKDGCYEIRDLGSSNNTWVNGRLITYHRLRDGDEILLGDVQLTFMSESSCAEADLSLLPDDGFSAREATSVILDHPHTILMTPSEIETQDLASLKKNHQRLMMLYELMSMMNGQLEDLSRTLDDVIDLAIRSLKAKRGFIGLVDEETGDLAYKVVQDLEEGGSSQRGNLKISRTLVHRVLKDGVALLFRNAMDEPDFKDIKTIQEYEIRPALCVPLRNRSRIIGLIYLDNRFKVDSFTEDDLAFLGALAYQAGIAIENARLYREVKQENERLHRFLGSEAEFKIIGQSTAMKRVFQVIKKVAPTDATVLITGESGTGKELIARNIHALSRRSGNGFVAVNCANLEKGRIEDELFGHEKGAFTDAKERREGKFQLAHSSTLFLDEIAEMSLEAQAKVLRVLQFRQFERVGGNTPIKVDVRLLAATSKNLKNAVEKGDFRQELYFRLNVVEIELPPLRERREDIPRIAEKFAARKGCRISPQAMLWLVNYDWPGNVRELENYLERAIYLGNGRIVQAEDLPHEVRPDQDTIPAPLPSLKEMERDHIVRVLRHTGWKRRKAARILSISPQTLYNKMEEYGISSSEKNGASLPE